MCVQVHYKVVSSFLLILKALLNCTFFHLASQCYLKSLCLVLKADVRSDLFSLSHIHTYSPAVSHLHFYYNVKRHIYSGQEVACINHDIFEYSNFSIAPWGNMTDRTMHTVHDGKRNGCLQRTSATPFWFLPRERLKNTQRWMKCDEAPVRKYCCCARQLACASVATINMRQGYKTPRCVVRRDREVNAFLFYC